MVEPETFKIFVNISILRVFYMYRILTEFEASFSQLHEVNLVYGM